MTPTAGRAPPPPARPENVAAPPASFRPGYGQYLRMASLPEVAALAVPGVAGLVLLTGAGGVIGYRHAKAGQVIRTSSIARFMT